MKPTTQEIEAAIARIGALEKELKCLREEVAGCRAIAKAALRDADYIAECIGLETRD